MAYEPTEWINGETALSAANLNHIEQGILDNSEAIESLGSGVGDVDIDELVNRVNQLATEASALQTQLSLLQGKFPITGNNIVDSDIPPLAFFTRAVYATNLNDELAGTKCFNPNTLNAPISGYGIVTTFANAKNLDDTYLWRYQLGFCTDRMFIRAKINKEGTWTTWTELEKTTAAIAGSRISDGSITTAKIGDKQVTGGKIANATITDINLAGSLLGRIPTLVANGSTTSGSFAVSGSFILIFRHNSTPGTNGIMFGNTAQNKVFVIAGCQNITASVANNTCSYTSSSGSPAIYRIGI